MIEKGHDVVTNRELDCVMIRVERLDEDPSWRVTAAGPAGDLDEELKRSLRRAEIRDRKGCVRVDHAHERDVREIVPLRHHLGSDEDVDLSSSNACEDLLDLLTARD